MDLEQKDALMELMAPDGYYNYLGLEKAAVIKPPAEGGSGLTPKIGEIDKEAVKKAYRKLSRKHHPDKGEYVEYITPICQSTYLAL